jgi:orotate phosphoribosyltransferase
MQLKRILARHLLEIDAVMLSPEKPFVWASGIQSPVYCDNRLTLAYPTIRSTIARGFVALINQLQLEPDVIIGTATAGIPHAALVANLLDLPMAYVRSKPKTHGRGNQVEGKLETGQKAVVIEDLISTGGSSIAAAQAVQEVGVEVEVVLAIFSYGLPVAKERFHDADLRFATLTDFPTLLDVAIETGSLSSAHLETLQSWQQEPGAWQG